MLEWHDFVEQLLSEESSFDGISLSFDGTAHSVGVPPIIKASVLMLDKMITHQGKFNILVFPERIQSIFIFTLIKLLHNIAEGKIERAYDPEAFKPGEKLKLGNAVVEFVGIEDEKNERRMKIKVADLTISAPIEYFPLFQLTNTQRRLSPYEKYVVEKKKIEGLVSHLTADEKFLKMLADYRTHMDSSIVSMTSVINAKELLSTCKLCGRDIKSILLVGQADYGAKAMRVDSEKDRDPYWTNIGYYNSIRELGQAATWIRADIDQHLDVMYKRRFEDKRYPTKEEYRKNRRYIWRDEELTSRISGSEVTASLANLGIRYPGEVDSEGKIKEHPIDICLATNMISVGLDVSRLGLMTVAGQPKTTSEYIQATSRVGRDAENAPGLVFVLYRPGRPRDKSHYEQFRSYHSRVYCNVEPTSVTPFSAPVRERALHAIMVGMMRLESDDRFNEDPPRFPNDGLIDKVRSVIENRVDDIDSEELDATLNRMEYILQCWEDWNPRKWEPAKNPDWSYADPVPLMYSAGSHPNEAWGSRGIETPTSMRSVDASCEAEVLTNRYVPKEG